MHPSERQVAAPLIARQLCAIQFSRNAPFTFPYQAILDQLSQYGWEKFHGVLPQKPYYEVNPIHSSHQS